MSTGTLRIAIPTRAFSPQLLGADGLLSDLSRELSSESAARVSVVVADDTGTFDLTDVLPGGGRGAAAHSAMPGSVNSAAANRNRAAEGSATEWLVFLDDDVRLPHGWLRALTAVITDVDAPDVIGGAVRSWNQHNWFSQAAEDFVIRHREYPEGWYLVAAFLIVRAEAFTSLGGFDEQFDRFAEDWDFSKRAHSLGLAVGVTSHVWVEHLNPTTWRELKGRASAYGCSNADFDRRAGAAASNAVSTTPATADADPSARTKVETQRAPRSPLRIARWMHGEFRLFRNQGKSRFRALRSTLLQAVWMREYFRAYAGEISSERKESWRI